MEQKAISIWLVGLSGSGKSTLANLLKQHLLSDGIRTVLLDGDILRKGLNSNLTFSDTDRMENIRRVAEVSKLFLQEQITTINSFICPTNIIRNKAKEIIGADNFYLIWLDVSLDICERRDPKGLYKKARAGEILQFSGIDSLFETPENPFLTIQTNELSENQSLELLMQNLNPIIYVSSI